MHFLCFFSFLVQNGFLKNVHFALWLTLVNRCIRQLLSRLTRSITTNRFWLPFHLFIFSLHWFKPIAFAEIIQKLGIEVIWLHGPIRFQLAVAWYGFWLMMNILVGIFCDRWSWFIMKYIFFVLHIQIYSIQCSFLNLWLLDYHHFDNVIISWLFQLLLDWSNRMFTLPFHINLSYYNRFI